MTMFKRVGFVLLFAMVCLTSLTLSEKLLVPGVSIVSTAQAIVGRPLTPVSYAGVARRTVRRCAAGVYYC
jgi:hypothetical protein